jgi:hypothetical protein
MKNLFILNQTYYDSYYRYFFEGPENISQEEFKEMCNSFLEQASYKAITAQYNEREYGPTWIGWSEIVEALVSVLEKRGFRRFVPKEVTYFGSGIVENNANSKLLGRALRSVLKFNDKIKRKLDGDTL